MRPLATQRLGSVPGWWLRIAGAACLRRTRMWARTAIMIAARSAGSKPAGAVAARAFSAFGAPRLRPVETHEAGEDQGEDAEEQEDDPHPVHGEPEPDEQVLHG